MNVRRREFIKTTVGRRRPAERRRAPADRLQRGDTGRFELRQKAGRGRPRPG